MRGTDRGGLATVAAARPAVNGWRTGGPSRRGGHLVGSLVGILVASGAIAALCAAQPAPAVRPVGEVVAFVNDWVRVHHALFEYPVVSAGAAEIRPVVVHVEVDLGAGDAGTQRCRRLLDAPRGVRPSWRPGVVPRGVHVDVLDAPPPPSELGDPGSDLPRDASEDRGWACGRLVMATFRPFDYGAGLGRAPSVTTFLSDGVVEVSSRGLRRRMGVQAGDAFWFEAGTRLTVIDDYPVAVAILQVPTR